MRRTKSVTAIPPLAGDDRYDLEAMTGATAFGTIVHSNALECPMPTSRPPLRAAEAGSPVPKPVTCEIQTSGAATLGTLGPPPQRATRRPGLGSAHRFHPVSRAAGFSPGKPVHHEPDAVQSNQGPSCPTARPPPVPLPLWSRLGPTCENASRVARQAELPAPPRFSRFPAHTRGVPPLPTRLDKGTGGRAAGHKEALS
jgi:hypothetical protein